MNIAYIIILLVIAGGVGVINQISKREDRAVKPKYKKEDNKRCYQARDKFFTRSEYMFFQELEKQNNGKYHIFSKVRLEDIVQVIPTLDYKIKRIKRNSIKSRHIDFILVDRETGGVVKAIELDGKSHNGSKQKASDDKKDLICKQVGIELVRVSVGDDFQKVITTLV